MPEINQQYNLKSAVGKNNIFDMSRQVVTTADFGHLKPIYLRYCVPGDKIKTCDVREFTRAMPMPAPTFGHIESTTRAFFVPIRSIMHRFNDFLTQTPLTYSSGTSSATIPQVPYIMMSELAYILHDYESFPEFSSKGSPSNYDVVHKGSDGNLYYSLFTSLGRRINDMLINLGINVTFGFDHTSSDSFKVNILPILALYKAYYDWIIPSRFLNSYSDIHKLIESIAATSDGLVPTQDFRNLLYDLSTFIDNDYFVNSFNSPSGTSPNNKTFSESSPLSDNSIYTQSNAVHLSGVTSYHASINVDSDNIDFVSLQTLGRLQNMLNRGMLAGTKIQDYLYSTFGIKPNNDAINISTYLGKHVNDIQISDVVSYADTINDSGGSYLGQYAGKSLGAGESSFTYEVKEHGYYIVTNEITPRASYYQGIAPEFDMLDVYDFYQPEFDNVGVEAIPYRRLNSERDYHQADNTFINLDSIFGWSPRYASLKTSFDAVSGDFRIKSHNTGLDSWYFARKFDSHYDVSNLPYSRISNEFCLASSSSPVNNFDHIFQYTSNNYDHFYQIFYIKCIMSRPMKRISDWALEDEPNDEGKDVHVSSLNNVQ